MSAIDFIARLAGVPDDLITEVEKAAPTAAALLQLVKDNQDTLNRLVTLLPQAVKEAEALIPAAQDVLKFMQARQAVASNYPDPAQS